MHVVDDDVLDRFERPLGAGLGAAVSTAGVALSAGSSSDGTNSACIAISPQASDSSGVMVDANASVLANSAAHKATAALSRFSSISNPVVS